MQSIACILFSAHVRATGLHLIRVGSLAQHTTLATHGCHGDAAAKALLVNFCASMSNTPTSPPARSVTDRRLDDST